MAVHPVESYLKDLSEIRRTGGGVAVYFWEIVLPHHLFCRVYSPETCIETGLCFAALLGLHMPEMSISMISDD